MIQNTASADAGKLAYQVDEAARASGLSRVSLYKLMGSGALASRKVGGRRLILAEDLKRLLIGEAA